jgi:hypothetical protein
VTLGAGPKLREVPVVLDPACRVRCRVVRAGDGRPIASARVLLCGEGRTHHALTDARGQVGFDHAAPGMVRLLARAEGYEPAATVPFDLRSPCGEQRLELAPLPPR